MTEEALVKVPLSAKSWEEAIRELSVLLHAGGYVRETFADAVVRRELDFPTGLQTSTIGVAIPHTDVDHVIEPAMAVGVARPPIDFGRMGGRAGESVSVQLVVLLAVKKPEKQLQTLQGLMDFFQNDGALAKAVCASSSSEIVGILGSYLGRMVERRTKWQGSSS